MNHARALGLISLAFLFSACGGGPAARATRQPSSAFKLQPDMSDVRCNEGRGVRLSAHLGDNPVVAAGLLADGSTLIAISGYPTERTVVLHSVTARCAPNPSFGEGGVATIKFPPRGRPGHTPAVGVPPNGIWVNVVAPSRDGGTILAGTYGDNWVVGRITSQGRIDPTFGARGWTVLPYHGEISAAVEEPDGRIIVAGDNGGGGCCTRTWAAALSVLGRADRSFGTNGRTELPTGEDSGVSSLALEPSGDILAAVGYGNMGCWGMALAMLAPSGKPLTLFARRLRRFWSARHFGAFVGNVSVEGDGFTLVGTGQQPCFEPPTGSARSATGLMARFAASGALAGPVVRFPSRMAGNVGAFRDGAETLVVTGPYLDSSRLIVTALRLNGSVDPRFGQHGRVRVHGPWWGQTARLETRIWVGSPTPGTLILAATQDQKKQLHLIRLRG